MCHKECVSNNTEAVEKALKNWNSYGENEGNNPRGATKSNSNDVSLALSRKLDNLDMKNVSKTLEQQMSDAIDELVDE